MLGAVQRKPLQKTYKIKLLAAPATHSGVMPNRSWSAPAGAEAPKPAMPMNSPSLPHHLEIAVIGRCYNAAAMARQARKVNWDQSGLV